MTTHHSSATEQARLEEAARRYRDFSELSRDWYWEMDDQLRFTYFSREFEETTGISLNDILGKTRWEGLGAEDYGDVDWDGHKKLLLARQTFHGFEYASRKLPGRTLWFRASGKPRFDSQGNFAGYFGIASEVTAFKTIEDKLRAINAEQNKLILELERTQQELKKALGEAAVSQRELEQAVKSLEQKQCELQESNEKLRVVSITDPLTEVYNRRFFLETTAKLASYAHRHRSALSIAMIDIDHFKKVNDTFGHAGGDRVLQSVVGVCIEALREEDVFARFGGEEFIIAFPNTPVHDAATVAERLRVALSGFPIDVGGTVYHASISCGVAQLHPNDKTIDDTIRRADEALYAAKSCGRNRVIANG